MPIYTIECWYRYNGGDDKDFFDDDIVAGTEEEAHAKAKALHRNIFKTYTRAVDGVPVKSLQAMNTPDQTTASSEYINSIEEVVTEEDITEYPAALEEAIPLSGLQLTVQQVLFDFDEFLHLNKLGFGKDSINLFVNSLANEPSATTAP